MHLCLGIHLARMEAEVALEKVFAQWPDLSLATPAENLHWLARSGMRGPMVVPMRLRGEGAARGVRRRAKISGAREREAA